ncbi:G2/M phase-specific E3 ubiquitin-protein ligase-like isoform X2 [Ptychodera flava]|uniref:G2/M phase-specific E3 ubiquitin-protein ligase-like isoform X2 n=1 Tax=Ptychodera flava TaxID=63121 RepID=UPI003969E3DE
MRAKDYGGPRKEFFALILREIKEKYFGDTLKEHLSEEYYLVGVILALSMLQNGKLAQFLADDVRQRLFDIEDETPCIAKLKDGLMTLGIHQLCMELPTMQYLFQPNTSSALTINKLKSLLTPTFSETGTNSRRFEGEIFALFLKYLREVSSGRRGNITLNDILQFVTGAEDEPVLGFRITPSVEFVEMTQSYLPTANTCINRLTLPRPTIEQQLLPTRQMYDLYDLAFSNRFFGNV